MALGPGEAKLHYEDFVSLVDALEKKSLENTIGAVQSNLFYQTLDFMYYRQRGRGHKHIREYLNVTNARPYLKILVNDGLLDRVGDGQRKHYKITEKGEKLYEQLKSIIQTSREPVS